MVAKFILIDPDGQSAAIDGEGAVAVVVHPHPPQAETVNTFPFTQLMTDDGLTTGTSDMKGTGTAAAPLLFWVPASQTQDIYIKIVATSIIDATATLAKFGNVTALINGCKLEHITSSATTQIGQDLKSNYDFVQSAAGQPAFGDGVGAFRASNVLGTAEGYMPMLDMATTFGMVYGLRLRAGTEDRLQMTIRDTTSGVEQFDCRVYGFKQDI